MNSTVASADKPASTSIAKTTTQAMSIAAYLRVLLIGTFFGVVLVKSEVVRWQRVHDMFLFREAHMYLIIATGIVVAAISMLLIKRFRLKTIDGKPIKFQGQPFQKGTMIGGFMFGAGWAITGACPGPIYAQLGAGVPWAIATLGGALCGMFAFAYLKPRLPS